MKVFSLIFVIIAIFAAIAIAEPVTEVKVFNDDNFYTYIEQNPQKRIMVKFFAPWCGHCRAMQPGYINAAEANTDEDVVFGEVDCTVSRALCKSFDVKGYPTIKIVHKGKHVEHTGERTTEALVESVRTAVTTDPIMIVRPPAIQVNDILAAILHDLKEMITLRFNATLLIVAVSFGLGYILRSSTTRPAKKSKKD